MRLRLSWGWGVVLNSELQRACEIVEIRRKEKRCEDFELTALSCEMHLTTTMRNVLLVHGNLSWWQRNWVLLRWRCMRFGFEESRSSVIDRMLLKHYQNSQKSQKNDVNHGAKHSSWILNPEFLISGGPLGKFWVSERSQILKKISGFFHFWMIKVNASPSNLEARWEIWFVNLILRNSFGFFSY